MARQAERLKPGPHQRTRAPDKDLHPPFIHTLRRNGQIAPSSADGRKRHALVHFVSACGAPASSVATAFLNAATVRPETEEAMSF